jgi:coatomer subunit beta'
VIVSLQRDVVAAYLEGGKPVDEEGTEDAFELLHEVNERVRTGIWVGDCFIYNNSSWRLNYCVGGEVSIMCSGRTSLISCSLHGYFVRYNFIVYMVIHYLQVTTMYHLDRPMYLLGYLANQSRVYLIDKQFKCVFLNIPPFLCPIFC